MRVKYFFTRIRGIFPALKFFISFDAEKKPLTGGYKVNVLSVLRIIMDNLLDLLHEYSKRRRTGPVQTPLGMSG
jgi:hypothetical protein